MDRAVVEGLARRHAAERLTRKARNRALREAGVDPDGPEGAAYRAAYEAARAEPRVARVWLFPEDEFEQWRRECHAGGQIDSYEAYRSAIAGMATKAAAGGCEVEFATMPVDEMMLKLRGLGLGNTSENRARVLAGEGRVVMGIKIAPNAVGSALVATPGRLVASRAVPLEEGESHADAVRRLLEGIGR